MVRGRLRPGCPAGPDAGGLGCDHFRPAGGDYGPVCRPGCPNWSAPRHRHRKDGAGWRGDHYTPAGRCLSGPPEAGDRDVHRLSGGGSAAPGLHHQRDGSGPAGDPVRPSGRPGRPDGEGPAVCGRAGPPVRRGCPPHPAGTAVRGGAGGHCPSGYSGGHPPEPGIAESHCSGADLGGAEKAGVRKMGRRGPAGLSGCGWRLLAGDSAHGGG